VVLIKIFESFVGIPRPNVIKTFTAVIYEFFNKLDDLSLSSFFRLVLCLWIEPDLTQVKGATLQGSLPDWRGWGKEGGVRGGGGAQTGSLILSHSFWKLLSIEATAEFN
jgi:hypothetical protein